jgi:hypothetical protein
MWWHWREKNLWCVLLLWLVCGVYT